MRICGICALLCAFAASVLSQSVPPLINYQGRLANPDGSPVSTADYQLSFRIYDAATNGALVWGPQIFDGLAAQGHGARVPVVQGYFSVILGPSDINTKSIADSFTGPNRYLEVTMSNRPPLSPRQQILTTPYTFLSGTVADGAVTMQKLASRPISTAASMGGLAQSARLDQ